MHIYVYTKHLILEKDQLRKLSPTHLHIYTYTKSANYNQFHNFITFYKFQIYF